MTCLWTRQILEHGPTRALLAPALESLAILRGKIIEQRGNEAQAVTSAMAQNLEPYKPSPKIEETLELLRARFEDNVKARR
jgi:hypothetical protein